MTDENRAWNKVADFETVTDATRRTIELEGISTAGIHVEMYVDTHGRDDEAFGHLEYTGRERDGKRTLYVIKRERLAH